MRDLGPYTLAALVFLAEAICIHSDHLVRNSFPLTILKEFFPQGKKWESAAFRFCDAK